MAESNQLAIVIKAQNEASAALSKAQRDLRSFADGADGDLKRVDKSSRGAADGLKAMTQVVAAGVIFDKLKQGLGASVSASNLLENSLTGLTSVARAFGQGQGEAADAAKRLASDGLMSVSEAATGLKNLLAAGYGLPEAITLMERFKDSASFNRQAALGFGQAIASATEGIKNGNSILVDNAGVTKNLSIILEEAGYSAQDLMKATTDAGVRQVIFNGILRETRPQLGDAARLAENFSGEQAKMGTIVFNTTAKLGDLAKMGLSPLYRWLTTTVSANQDLIVAFVSAGAAVAGFLAVLAGGAGLIATIGFVVATLGGPLTFVLVALSALLGGTVFGAVRKVQDQMSKTQQTFQSGAEGMKRAADGGMTAAGKKASDLADKLQTISDNVKKAERDFTESLAGIVKSHQDKITELTAQVGKEKAAFDKAQEEKTASYKASQEDQLREHERRVDDLQTQIAREVAQGQQADANRLADLRLRLQRENEDYERDTAAKLAEYQKDTANAKTEQDTKLAELQAKLTEETAFLQKHSDDVRAIRDVQLLDEIDKLKRSHVEKLAEFEKQKRDAIKSAQEATSGMASAFNELPSMVNTGILAAPGREMGRQMMSGLKQALMDAWNNIGSWITANAYVLVQKLGASVAGLLSGKSGKERQAAVDAIPFVPFAEGGIVDRPTFAMMGEGGRKEAIVPLTNPTRAAEVMREAGLAGAGGINVVQHIYNQVDYEQGLHELGWRLQVA